MGILLEILKGIVFLSWICFTVYSYFKLKKAMRTLAVKHNLTVPFECCRCHTVFDYPYEVYLKIARKVRNDYITRLGNSITRYREFKYLCEKCGSDQWQKQLKIQPFQGSTCAHEFTSLLVKAAIKVFVAGLLTPLFIILLSAMG